MVFLRILKFRIKIMVIKKDFLLGIISKKRLGWNWFSINICFQ